MVKKSLKFLILAYASEPDKNYKYEGDIVEYEGKRYFVSLAEERVEFVGNVPVENVTSESKAFAEFGKYAAAGFDAGIKSVEDLFAIKDIPEEIIDKFLEAADRTAGFDHVVEMYGVDAALKWAERR